MSNQLEKLKNSIKKEYVSQFELNLMKTSGFIPVDKRQNNFYVILNKDYAKNKNSISSIIQEKLGELVPQFIPVESNDFDAIIHNISAESNEQTNNIDSNEISSSAESNVQKELSPEEMLVGIGWITESQLQEAQRISANREIPLDGVFFEKQMLTPDKIAS